MPAGKTGVTTERVGLKYLDEEIVVVMRMADNVEIRTFLTNRHKYDVKGRKTEVDDRGYDKREEFFDVLCQEIEWAYVDKDGKIVPFNTSTNPVPADEMKRMGYKDMKESVPSHLKCDYIMQRYEYTEDISKKSSTFSTTDSSGKKI